MLNRLIIKKETFTEFTALATLFAAHIDILVTDIN